MLQAAGAAATHNPRHCRAEQPATAEATAEIQTLAICTTNVSRANFRESVDVVESVLGSAAEGGCASPVRVVLLL